MLRTFIRFRWALIGLSSAALVLFTSTALAGSGSGGVFNLGVSNSVNATTSLHGSSAGPQLSVANANTGAKAFSLYALLSATSPTANTAPVRGQNKATNAFGYGVWGSQAGGGAGVFGTALTGTGVYGRHIGASGTGAGVEGKSASVTSPGLLGYNSAGGPAVQANVKSNAVAPLSVNSTHVVPNLHAANSDALAGHGSSYFLPASGTAANSSKLGGNTPDFFQQRVAGSCNSGEAIRMINGDGTVACESIPPPSSSWALGGNAGTNPGTDFLGTTDNKTLELKANSALVLRLEPDASSPSLIGGLFANDIPDGAHGAVIGGGGEAGLPNADCAATTGSSLTCGNEVFDHFGTIGGGEGNQTGDSETPIDPTNSQWNTVGGGIGNVASGKAATVGGGDDNSATDTIATVGGGSENSAARDDFVGGGFTNQATGRFTTVGGGEDNIAGADGNEYSTVGGGLGNHATGFEATIPGGVNSLASGNESFAAGTQADATNFGSFVWGDATYSNIASPADNSFTVRAHGGIWFGDNSSPSVDPNHLIDTSSGAYLTRSGTWVGNNASGGPGLEADVNPGVAPLSVNSSTKVDNLNADQVDGKHASDLWQVGGNAGATGVLGTQDNNPLEFVVNGERGLLLEPNSFGNPPNLIGGAGDNSVGDLAFGGTIAGGGGTANANQAFDTWDTISGGADNTTGIQDGNSGNEQGATVGGGYANSATALSTVVAGGYGNNASGTGATVPGGEVNTASGGASFAAGTYGQATHDGSFVWGDFTGTGAHPTADTGANQFVARASGGVTFYSSAAGSADSGVTLAPGGGSWSSLSDRHSKRNLVRVDSRAVLAKVARLPVFTWGYKAQSPSIRHMGPMAQRFYRTFHLGESKRYIDTIDSEGVALVAIKGLYQQNRALQRQNRELNARVAKLERDVAPLLRKGR